MLSRIVAVAVTQFWEQKLWKNFCQRAKWNDVTPLSAPSNWFCRDWMNLVTILRGTTKGQSKYVHQFIMDADSSRCGLDSFWHFGTVFAISLSISLCGFDHFGVVKDSLHELHHLLESSKRDAPDMQRVSSKSIWYSVQQRYPKTLHAKKVSSVTSLSTSLNNLEQLKLQQLGPSDDRQHASRGCWRRHSWMTMFCQKSSSFGSY